MIRGKVPEFRLTTTQCRILLALDEAKSITELASMMERDPSVICRQLKRIRTISPLIEKVGGAWRLTDLGWQMCRWARKILQEQNEILSRPTAVKIAADREFMARVIAPRLSEILGGESAKCFSMDRNAERSLLSGEIDLCIASITPTDPGVHCREVGEEPKLLVATPKFLQLHGVKTADDLSRLAEVRYHGPLSAQDRDLEPRVVATFDDYAAAREACLADIGWAVLPIYACLREVSSGELQMVPDLALPADRIYLWWRESQPELEQWVVRISQWLENIRPSGPVRDPDDVN